MRTNLDLREQTMTSLEIAELTGKPHNDVLKAIRKMEPAWTQVTQGKFSLSSYQDATGRTLPRFFEPRLESGHKKSFPAGEAFFERGFNYESEI